MLWVATAAGLLALVLLIIFILQNQEPVTVHYFELAGTVSLGVGVVIGAVGGGIIVATAGTARIIQLRRRTATASPRTKTVPGGVRIKLTPVTIHARSRADFGLVLMPLLGHTAGVMSLAVFPRPDFRSAGPEPVRRQWPGTRARPRIIDLLVGRPSDTGYFILDEHP